MSSSDGVQTSVQIFYSLSEWHTHVDFKPSQVERSGLPQGLPKTAMEVLFLVIKFADNLPPWHRQQTSCADTALLVVNCSPGP